MRVAHSVNKVPIRLTEERWFHIVENHNDLAGWHDSVLDTIENPDFISKGYREALLAIRRLEEKRYLCVVYKEITREDGFVITAYFTSRMKMEAIIWQRKP